MIKSELKVVLSRANRQEYRKFGLTIGIVFCVIATVLFWKTKASAPYVAGIGIAFILFGLIIPTTLKYVYWVWMSFAVIMGFIMSRVILTIIFFLLFAPVGLMTRLLGKDLLKEKWDKDTQSYWIKRERKPYDPRSAENQF